VLRDGRAIGRTSARCIRRWSGALQALTKAAGGELAGGDRGRRPESGTRQLAIRPTRTVGGAGSGRHEQAGLAAMAVRKGPAAARGAADRRSLLPGRGLVRADRARAGNQLSWVYVFEWPFFAAFSGRLWWRLRMKRRAQALISAPRRWQEQAAQPMMSRPIPSSGPGTSTLPGCTRRAARRTARENSA